MVSYCQLQLYKRHWSTDASGCVLLVYFPFPGSFILLCVWTRLDSYALHFLNVFLKPLPLWVLVSYRVEVKFPLCRQSHHYPLYLIWSLCLPCIAWNKLWLKRRKPKVRKTQMNSHHRQRCEGHLTQGCRVSFVLVFTRSPLTLLVVTVCTINTQSLLCCQGV